MTGIGERLRAADDRLVPAWAALLRAALDAVRATGPRLRRLDDRYVAPGALGGLGTRAWLLALLVVAALAASTGVAVAHHRPLTVGAATQAGR